MVPWSHLRHPFLGRMWTDLTSEFTHFNLVIRLSKMKQPAFRFCAFWDVPLLLSSFVNLGKVPVCSREAIPNNQRPSFIADAQALQHDKGYWRQQACPLPAGMVFLVSGGVKHCVHLIHWIELEQPFNAYVVWPTTVPSREWRTTL